MEAELMRALRLFTILMPLMLSAKDPLVTIEDTGSTNRLGLRVTFDREGQATVDSRSRDTRHIKLAESLSKQFMLDLEAVGPLIDIPVVHCMKSVSFGSSLFVEFNGHRSPDLSCPGHDSHSGQLQKDANQILQAAREAAGIPSRRIIAVPVPKPPE
jgi:hypothetical protein